MAIEKKEKMKRNKNEVKKICEEKKWGDRKMKDRKNQREERRGNESNKEGK